MHIYALVEADGFGEQKKCELVSITLISVGIKQEDAGV